MAGMKFYSKPRRKRIGPEACLQITVIEHLRLLAKSGVIYFSIPNEGKRSEAQGAYLKRMGMLPGAPDLCIIVPAFDFNDIHFLELKSRDGKLSDDQIAFRDMCARRRIPYSVAYNIDEALRFLRECGAIPDK